MTNDFYEDDSGIEVTRSILKNTKFERIHISIVNKF